MRQIIIPSDEAQFALLHECASVPYMFQTNKIKPVVHRMRIGIFKIMLKSGESHAQTWMINVRTRAMTVKKDAAMT